MKRFAPLLLAALSPLAAPAQTTSNPFPVLIPKGDLVVAVADFAAIPKYNGQIPRVHQLLPAPDGRIFVLDQLGAISVVSADGATVTRYLDVKATAGVSLLNSGEQGLESMAFHPDFLNVGTPGYGRFYTAHTTSNTTPPADYVPGGGGDAGDNVVLEWHAADPTAATFTAADSAAPFREILRVEAPYSNHTIGLVAFNPNSTSGELDYGKLYVGLGDGGSGGDPLHLAQNPAKPHGKILRIDPLGTDGPGGKYGIPADNPFVGVNGTLPEIWALGFRNPQRFSWDRAGNKSMFIGDIGQGTVEEIDIGVAGANYGWGDREGSYVSNNGTSVGANARADAGTTGFTYPIAEYDHDEGSAITGGFVDRGTAIPGLTGQYLFGDLARGRVFYFSGDQLPAGGQSPIRELRLVFGGTERSLLAQIQTTQPGASRVDLRFGTDAAGRIFLLNKQDGIVRLLVGPATIPPATPPPVVTVAGKKRLTTASRNLAIHGRATSLVGVAAVEVRLAAGRFRRAQGTTTWRYVLRHLARDHRNRVTIRAVDVIGGVSAVKTIYVTVR